MIKNKDLFSKNHINLDNYFLCFEYTLEKENGYQVFINDDRFAVGGGASPNALRFDEVNLKKGAPYLMGVNQMIKINGYYLLHRKGEAEDNPWTATSNKIVSEKPQESAIKQLLKSFSIIVKKNDDKAGRLLFMGNINNAAQRLLVENINSSYRALIESYYEPAVSEMPLNEEVEFYMGNKLFDTLTNCYSQFYAQNGMMEIIKGLEIELPTDYAVVKSIHHENESGSIKWVHESHIEDFLTNNPHTEILKSFIEKQ